MLSDDEGSRALRHSAASQICEHEVADEGQTPDSSCRNGKRSTRRGRTTRQQIKSANTPTALLPIDKPMSPEEKHLPQDAMEQQEKTISCSNEEKTCPSDDGDEAQDVILTVPQEKVVLVQLNGEVVAARRVPVEEDEFSHRSACPISPSKEIRSRSIHQHSLVLLSPFRGSKYQKNNLLSSKRSGINSNCSLSERSATYRSFVDDEECKNVYDLDNGDDVHPISENKQENNLQDVKMQSSKVEKMVEVLPERENDRKDIPDSSYRTPRRLAKIISLARLTEFGGSDMIVSPPPVAETSERSSRSILAIMGSSRKLKRSTFFSNNLNLSERSNTYRSKFAVMEDDDDDETEDFFEDDDQYPIREVPTVLQAQAEQTPNLESSPLSQRPSSSSEVKNGLGDAELSADVTGEDEDEPSRMVPCEIATSTSHANRARRLPPTSTTVATTSPNAKQDKLNKVRDGALEEMQLDPVRTRLTKKKQCKNGTPKRRDGSVSVMQLSIEGNTCRIPLSP